MEVDFFANGLCLHCHLAQNELINFISFNDETENSWKKKDEKLQEKLDEILSKYPKEHHRDIIEIYSWELHLNQTKYPSIHRESLVITIYNFFEDQLNLLCAIFSECVNSNIKLKDLKGQGIERGLLYLSKVASIDLSGMGRELPYIKNVNALRNQIVHNGAFLPENPEHKVNKFVSQNPNLSGEASGAIYLRPGFIDEMIKVLIDFFEKLGNEVQAFIHKYNA